MKRMVAATPARDSTNARNTLASALRLTMSMTVRRHIEGAVITDVEAQNRNANSPNQLVGRPNRSVSIGQTAARNTIPLAINVCVGVVTSFANAGFLFRSRIGKNDAMDLM